MTSDRFRLTTCATLAAAALAVASCSSGSGSDSPAAGADGAPTTASSASTEAGAPTQPGVVEPGRWDIDAALAADPDCPAPITGEPLIVGYAADLGELGSFADAPGSQAAEYIAKLINCSGGLNGRPVQVITADISGPDPLVSRTGTLGLLQGGAEVLLGPPFPDPGFRVLEVTDSKVPVIFTGSTEPALADDSHLSYLVAFNDTQGATAAAQFAQSQSWRSAVTFSAPGPYFGYNPTVFSSVFTALGGKVLADYPLEVGAQTDFTEAIAQMAADPPDVIYSGMLANQLVALNEQLDQAGLTNVQILGTDSFEATNGYSLAPGNEGIYHVTHTDPQAGTRLELMLNNFTAANGGVPASSPSMAALAGDAMAVIADAYLRVGTTDPVAIGQAISTATNVQGITGVLTYDHSGSPSKPMYIHKVVGGKATLAGVIGG